MRAATVALKQAAARLLDRLGRTVAAHGRQPHAVLHDGANEGLQALEFGQIIFAKCEHDLDVLAQQIELIQKLRVLGQFAFQRGRQPVFDQFAQLLQQHLRARGLLRRLPAQRKDLLKLIERQHGHNRAPMGIEELACRGDAGIARSRRPARTALALTSWSTHSPMSACHTCSMSTGAAASRLRRRYTGR